MAPLLDLAPPPQRKPTEYTECEAFYQVVRIGYPLARKRVLLTPFGPRGEIAGEGVGRDLIPTTGQTLWYSRYTIIPLRANLHLSHHKKKE